MRHSYRYGFFSILFLLAIVSSFAYFTCNQYSGDIDHDGQNEIIKLVNLTIDSSDCMVKQFSSTNYNFVCKALTGSVNKIFATFELSGLPNDKDVTDYLSFENFSLILTNEIKGSCAGDPLNSKRFSCEFDIGNANFAAGFGFIYNNGSAKWCIYGKNAIFRDSFPPRLNNFMLTPQNSLLNITLYVSEGTSLSKVKVKIVSPSGNANDYDFVGNQIKKSGSIYWVAVDLTDPSFPKESGNFRVSIMSLSDALGNTKNYDVADFRKTIFLDREAPIIDLLEFYYNNEKITESTSVLDFDQPVNFNAKLKIKETSAFTIFFEIDGTNYTLQSTQCQHVPGSDYDCNVNFEVDLSRYNDNLVTSYIIYVIDRYGNKAIKAGPFSVKLEKAHFILTNITGGCGKFVEDNGEYYYVLPEYCDDLDVRLHFFPPQYIGRIIESGKGYSGPVPFLDGMIDRTFLDETVNYTFKVCDFTNAFCNNFTVQVIKSFPTPDEDYFKSDDEGFIHLKTFYITSYFKLGDLLDYVYYFNSTNNLTDHNITFVGEGGFRVDDVSFSGACIRWLKGVYINVTPLLITPSEPIVQFFKITENNFSTSQTVHDPDTRIPIEKNQNEVGTLNLIVDTKCGKFVVPLYNYVLKQESNETPTQCLYVEPGSGHSVPMLFASMFSGMLKDEDGYYKLQYYFNISRNVSIDICKNVNIYRSSIDSCKIVYAENKSKEVEPEILDFYNGGFDDPYYFLSPPVKFVYDEPSLRTPLAFDVLPKTRISELNDFDIICNVSLFIQTDKAAYTKPITLTIDAPYNVVFDQDYRFKLFELINQTWHEIKNTNNLDFSSWVGWIGWLQFIAALDEFLFNLDIALNGACYALCPYKSVPVILPFQLTTAFFSNVFHLGYLGVNNFGGYFAKVLMNPMGIAAGIQQSVDEIAKASYCISGTESTCDLGSAMASLRLPFYLLPHQRIKKPYRFSFANQGWGIDALFSLLGDMLEGFIDKGIKDKNFKNALKEWGEGSLSGVFVEFIKNSYWAGVNVIKDLYLDPSSNIFTSISFLSAQGYLANEMQKRKAKCDYLQCLVESYKSNLPVASCRESYEINVYKHDFANVQGVHWLEGFLFVPLLSVIYDFNNMNDLDYIVLSLAFAGFGNLTGDIRSEVFGKWISSLSNEGIDDYIKMLAPELFNETLMTESSNTPFGCPMCGVTSGIGYAWNIKGGNRLSNLWWTSFRASLSASMIYFGMNLLTKALDTGFDWAREHLCRSSERTSTGITCPKVSIDFSVDLFGGGLESILSKKFSDWIIKMGCNLGVNIVYDATMGAFKQAIEDALDGYEKTGKFDVKEFQNYLAQKISSRINDVLKTGLDNVVSATGSCFGLFLENLFVSAVTSTIIKKALKSLNPADCGCGMSIDQEVAGTTFAAQQIAAGNASIIKMVEGVGNWLMQLGYTTVESSFNNGTAKCAQYRNFNDWLYNGSMEMLKTVTYDVVYTPSMKEKIKEQIAIMCGLFGWNESVCGTFGTIVIGEAVQPDTRFGSQCPLVDDYSNFEEFSDKVLGVKLSTDEE